jgi:hypothetical protein
MASGRRAVATSSGAIGYLVLVVVLPVLGTGGAAALLAGAFTTPYQPRMFRIAGAVVLLVAIGLLVAVTSAGGGYSVLAGVHELVVASATALVGAGVLALKPPAARRVAAALLVTAYPLILVGFALVGSMFASSPPPAGR